MPQGLPRRLCDYDSIDGNGNGTGFGLARWPIGNPQQPSLA